MSIYTFTHAWEEKVRLLTMEVQPMKVKITYEPNTLEDAVRFLDEFCSIELRGKTMCLIEGGFSSQGDDEEE